MITYTTDAVNISDDQLQGFFVGWGNPPSSQTMLKLLTQSDYIVLALDSETNHVVGFISAVSDHTLSAYIPFLEVLPAYQNNNIGTELTKQMLNLLKDYYMVDLLCDADVQSFYEKVGMKKANGMMLRNYDKQSGK
ncbi:MAG: GNAT family N-acetyltransferase [Candidatus Paceibacterota bacterium]|jgi:ribosomal protein S18 acetylase RimI-like enzyme